MTDMDYLSKLCLMLLFIVTELGLMETQKPPYKDPTDCEKPFGLSVKDVYSKTAMFAYDGNPEDGRLHSYKAFKTDLSLRHELGGKPDISKYAMLQVDLIDKRLITAAQLQGDPASDTWVTSFTVDYSEDCNQDTYKTMIDMFGDTAVFHGNHDRNSIFQVNFHDIAIARCVRIIPKSIHGNFTALRLELLGCGENICEDTQTKHLNRFHTVSRPHKPLGLGKFYQKLQEIQLSVPTTREKGYVQFDFDSEQLIFGIEIYRTNLDLDSTPRYYLMLSRSCSYFTTVTTNREGYRTTIFNGPDKWTTSSKEMFPFPIRAQCMRVYPFSHKTQDATDRIRARFIGCGTGKSTLSKCGLRKEKHHDSSRWKRVIGGDPMPEGAWPWLVGFRFMTDKTTWQQSCAAVLVHQQYVITAAHCLYAFYLWTMETNMTAEWDQSMWNEQKFLDKLFLQFGEHHIHTFQGMETSRNIVEIVAHQEYNISYYINDIAVMKMDQPIHYTDHIHSICMPDNATQFPEGSHCHIAGWGYTNKEWPDVPHEVMLELNTLEDCRSRYSHLTLTEDMVCAGPYDGSRDACLGDSGGPLMCQDEDQWHVVGLASWNIGCANPGYPGIYANVGYLREWIDKTIESLETKNVKE